MYKSFVLINCKPSKESEILAQLHESELPDLIPDVTPEQKKPLEKSDSGPSKRLCVLVQYSNNSNNF